MSMGVLAIIVLIGAILVALLALYARRTIDRIVAGLKRLGSDRRF